MNPRDLTLRILNKLTYNPSFSNHILKHQLGVTKLNEKDRALVVNLVQGVIRWKLRLDWIIEQFLNFPFKKLDPYVLNILRIALYQIFFMDRIPEFAAVNEAVRQAKRKAQYIANTVNGILRNICRNKDKIKYPDKEKEFEKFLSIYYSFPLWLVKKWKKELGSNKVELLLKALNKEPFITLRANRLKITRERLINLLIQKGIRPYPTKYSPCGIVIKRLHKSIGDMEEYKKGLFFVQDEASQLCSFILDPKPKEVLLDMCAGVGTKSIHIAELIENKGKIIALDINPKRLLILAQAIKKALMEKTIYPVLADGKKVHFLFKIPFDRIIIDAPCSGLGTIARHPDIKWTKTENDITVLAELQKGLLNAASYVVKDGGYILYITCTISQEENELVVEHFLKEHSKIRLVNISDKFSWLKDLVDENGFFRTYPYIHNMDGFFGALFKRS